MAIEMKASQFASLVFFVVVFVSAVAAGGTGEIVRAKRESSVSIPWLIDCVDSVDCIFKITEFATYR